MNVNEFLGRLENVHKSGQGWTARCPAHDDQHNSLTVAAGKDGRILVNCHAGCSADAITAAMGLTAKDLFKDATTRARGPAEIVAVYTYPTGAQKVRRADKSFYWRHPDRKGGYLNGRGDLPRSLYIAGAVSGKTVYVCEGEKDADNVFNLGLNAVSGEDGAGPGKWRMEYTRQLQYSRLCLVCPDNDPPGIAYAQETAAAIHATGVPVKLLDLRAIWPDIPLHGDISDLIEHFGEEDALAKLDDLARVTPPWTQQLPPPTPPTAPPAGKTDVQQAPGLHTINAADLQTTVFNPMRYAVKDLLPEGLTVLAAPPKYGKSWLALDLCLSVAAGGPFLGYPTGKGSCLYLALEDSERRLQARMERLLNGRQAPGSFYLATSAPGLDGGLLGRVEEHISKHPDTALVIIDTLQKVRGAPHGKEPAYSADYREMGELKKISDAHHIAVVVIHHLRKMVDDADPFNRISGTNGIAGSADTVLVLTREKRTSETAKLYVSGRDVEQRELVLKFNAGRWLNMGDVDAYEAQQAMQAYSSSPIVKTIKALLKDAPAGWSGTAQQLLDAGPMLTGKRLASTAKDLSVELKRLDPLLLSVDGIAHTRQSNGSGGGKHYFKTVDAATSDAAEQTAIEE